MRLTVKWFVKKVTVFYFKRKLYRILTRVFDFDYYQLYLFDFR